MKPCFATTLLAFLPLPAMAAAEEPPVGRYRCYAPPSYSVTAWFDIVEPGRYLFQGRSAGRYAYDPAKNVVTWLDGGFAGDYAGARFYTPSDQAPTGQRYAIVLTPRDGREAPASECLLTTH